MGSVRHWDRATNSIAAITDAAAFAAAANAVGAGIESINAVNADLALAESGDGTERLLAAPLWLDGKVPEAIAWVFEQGFKSSVTSLIEETSEPDTREALTNLWLNMNIH